MSESYEIIIDAPVDNLVHRLLQYIKDSGGDPNLFDLHQSKDRTNKRLVASDSGVYKVIGWPYESFAPPEKTSLLPSIDMTLIRKRSKKQFLMREENRRILALLKSMIATYNEKIDDKKKTISFEQVIDNSISDTE